MPLYKPAPVTDQPEISLSSWQVFLADRGVKTMHFVGRDLAAEGRVSSRIVAFDRGTMTGRTRSGRTYGLVGASGACNDAAYVWNRWKEIYRVREASAASVDELEAFLAEGEPPQP